MFRTIRRPSGNVWWSVGGEGIIKRRFGFIEKKSRVIFLQRRINKKLPK